MTDELPDLGERLCWLDRNMLEDWRAGLLESQRKNRSGDEPPLHQLLHEILDFTVVNPHLISAVNCYKHFTVMERGPAELPPAGINLAAPGDYVLATG